MTQHEKTGLCTQNKPIHIKLNLFIIVQAICNLQVRSIRFVLHKWLLLKHHVPQIQKCGQIYVYARVETNIKFSVRNSLKGKASEYSEQFEYAILL